MNDVIFFLLGRAVCTPSRLHSSPKQIEQTCKVGFKVTFLFLFFKALLDAFLKRHMLFFLNGTVNKAAKKSTQIKAKLVIISERKAFVDLTEAVFRHYELRLRVFFLIVALSIRF